MTSPAPEVLGSLPRVPRRLKAAEPSWTETTDVCVIGSGIAGLTTALHLREAGLHVTVVTKVDIDDGSTRWAQGGIAAVLDPLDTPEAHAVDTEIAGVGLCDPEAVKVLVTEGPAQVRELIRAGAEFDRNSDGSLQLTREGGHRANRIIHAGGDATGAEVQRALHAAVHRDPWIRLIEHALVLDLLTDAAGRACGVTLHVLGEGAEDGVGAVLARAVVLATGGMGQIYSATTNPVVSTGDGVALALRAGAAVTDIEFVQFHPTALALNNRDSQQPLVSEALRGEGAYLRDGDGNRFMVGRHELAELAPRDVVAKGIYRVM
ncbi:MAG TPA: FAD-dependent oxidoreductase, partial [Phytomonospora sp.]